MKEAPVRVLVIDDESAIRNVIRVGLEAQGLSVALAADGAQGLGKALEFHPQVVILDLGLPDMGGLEVLRRLREWTSVPVIILTVNDDEPTKVRLLDAGADDYLTKPFGLPELLARLRVALRHHHAAEATPVIETGDLRIDLNQREVRREGRVVKLTATEYAILSRLARQAGRVIPQSQLLTEIWGIHSADQSHYLRIYIAHLRKKLEKEPSAPRHILTEPGVGYRFG
ncbi:MAG: response regulator transcription factor [Bdellovibrionaceae bacterium]|nr:response regulator transcription factor [Pseudobdellovibrionaceae bacterium]MBX3033527.1 response regulator transcription factor [Pseudobdellovibrionaceae bacterium]